jgi:sigma-B regulation protein RsbU (phosphoserine phosphatase)
MALFTFAALHMQPRRPKSSIVLRLSFLYIGLMLFNLSIFWFASGSNQMRLIAEKATMSAQSISFEIFRRLQPVLDKAFTGKADPTIAFAQNREAFVKSLKVGGAGDKLIIPSLRVFSTDLQMLLTYPADAAATVTPDDLQHAYKALQLKDLKNEIFYGVPDILRYRIDIYLPLTSTGVNDLVLSSRIPLEAIERELASLLRLGIVMIGLLLVVQTAVGFVIYRALIRPIKTVSSAAEELSRGEFTQIEFKTKRDDEIKTLVDSFNHMSSELKVKDETIRQNLAAIKKKNDIAQFELNIAQKIQASVLPAQKDVGHVRWLVEYQPLYTVSGDYYDILRLEDGSVALFIGDASGHGVPAAFLTIMAKIYFSSLVEKIKDPAQLLQHISELMAGYLEMEGLYMTGFYMRIYPDNRAEYCNCIHPTPLILRKATGELEQLKSTGFYIGMINEDGKKNETKSVQLYPGDRLVLYSDGITEAKNAQKKMYSLDRFSEVLRVHKDESSENLRKILLESLKSYLDGVPLNDDLTLLIAEIASPAES